MATMVLTAVGTALGGPIGAAIGATLGQVVDNQILFAPKARQGPRLSDLRLQTSRYGDGVPRLYGAMRVAGSVIWATDLAEHRQRQGGGKGQPKVTTYSYSASFAVALSSRPVKQVRRVWADGNLLRGVAGDFKTSVGAFRLHHGGEDQLADPLIAAHKGLAATPAHRGIAYVVFEDMQLGDYGNRIPSLTFEVIADDGPVSIVTIADDLIGGALSVGEGGAGGQVMGYAASGTVILDALTPLVEGMDIALTSDEDGLHIAGGDEDAFLPAEWIGARFNGADERGITLSRNRAEDVPQRMTVLHYDPARDYQAGSQAAERPGPGRGQDVLDMPAALDAASARQMAETHMQRLWAGRSMMELRCDWRALSFTPATIIRVEGYAGRWRVEESEWQAMAVRLRLKRLSGGSSVTFPASPGESVRQEDAIHGPTRLIVADLPPPDATVLSAPLVVVAAAGLTESWRQAELFVEDRGTGGLSPLGGSALPATMGQVLTVPDANASSALFDDMSAIEVELLHSKMQLSDADDGLMLAGVNYALIGQEVIQFGRAIPIGPTRWRLEHLLRGRRGTEWAMAQHQAGERFLLLDEQTSFPLPPEMVQAGAPLSINAIGPGDVIPAQAQENITGQAMMPLSPVHLRASPQEGGWRIDWMRRSRAGWNWADYVDAPLAEEQERYLINLMFQGALIRQAEESAPLWHYNAAAIATDRASIGGVGGEVILSVRQIGTHGVGKPALLSLIL